jgi:ribonuclease-3
VTSAADVAAATAQARGALLVWLEGVVGPGEIPRLLEALTHSSYANETGDPDNQRLEFLGDAVLGLCVSEFLSAARPTANEGTLTRMRSALVNAEALARWGRARGLADCLAMGKGARTGGDRDQINVLADAVEAIVAAVYEARGLAGARALVADITGEALQGGDLVDVRDPKSTLQELVQAAGYGEPPQYRVVSVAGLAHDPTFEVCVLAGDEVLGTGSGRSKRAAERAAAAAALKAWGDPSRDE